MGVDKSSIGRQLASLRQRVTHVCPVCGQKFEGTKRRVYCSVACKLKSFRRKQSGEELGS
jgi:hypothetical protein